MRVKRNIAISDSGFLFNPSSGDSYSVNPIGLEIFRLLKEGKNQDEVKDAILGQYETDSDSFDKDFYDFTVMLKNYKLLENE